MMNSNYGKTYNRFAEHPLSSTYFKYIKLRRTVDRTQINQRHILFHRVGIRYQIELD